MPPDVRKRSALPSLLAMGLGASPQQIGRSPKSSRQFCRKAKRLPHINRHSRRGFLQSRAQQNSCICQYPVQEFAPLEEHSLCLMTIQETTSRNASASPFLSPARRSESTWRKSPAYLPFDSVKTKFSTTNITTLNSRAATSRSTYPIYMKRNPILSS